MSELNATNAMYDTEKAIKEFSEYIHASIEKYNIDTSSEMWMQQLAHAIIFKDNTDMPSLLDWILLEYYSYPGEDE